MDILFLKIVTFLIYFCKRLKRKLRVYWLRVIFLEKYKLSDRLINLLTFLSLENDEKGFIKFRLE